AHVAENRARRMRSRWWMRAGGPCITVGGKSKLPTTAPCSPSITLLGSSSKSAEMDFRTTWTTPAFGQTRIALTEPVPLAFADLSPPELNRVILGVAFRKSADVSWPPSFTIAGGINRLTIARLKAAAWGRSRSGGAGLAANETRWLRTISAYLPFSPRQPEQEARPLHDALPRAGFPGLSPRMSTRLLPAKECRQVLSTLLGKKWDSRGRQ